jgi:hypothetical protein
MFKFLEKFTEVIAWLEIFLSFTFLGILTAFLIYLIFLPNTAGEIIGIIIASTGFLTGLYLAKKAWRTTGTVRFISGESQAALNDTTENNSANESAEM